MHSFTSISPQPALQPFVRQFVLYEGNSDSWIIQKLIPGNFQNICFVLAGRMHLYTRENTLPILKNYVIGQISQPYALTYQEYVKLLVIYFRPTGMYQLFGIPMNKFTNLRIDFESVRGAEGTSLIEKVVGAFDFESQITIIEKYLLQKIEKKSGLNAQRIEYASDLIQHQNGIIKLKSLLSHVNMCERNFERCFIEKIGISPKAFSGFARVNRVLQMVESLPKYLWKDIAYELNYSDPAHFSHDFKKVAGMSPTEYYNLKADFEHFLYGDENCRFFTTNTVF